MSRGGQKRSRGPGKGLVLENGERFASQNTQKSGYRLRAYGFRDRLTVTLTVTVTVGAYLLCKKESCHDEMARLPGYDTPLVPIEHLFGTFFAQSRAWL
jgi:hypothetical protein